MKLTDPEIIALLQYSFVRLDGAWFLSLAKSHGAETAWNTQADRGTVLSSAFAAEIIKRTHIPFSADERTVPLSALPNIYEGVGAMPFYEFEGKSPVLDPSCFIHPDAVLIGDVTIGKKCFIGAGAVLRGDYGHIIISDGANVQENCVIHALPDTTTLIEADVDVGHGCIIHGPCTISSNVTVGMGSVICNGCTVGRGSFIGAGSVLPANLVIPEGKLAYGNPAKVIKDTNEYQQTFTKTAIHIYIRNYAAATIHR